MERLRRKAFLVMAILSASFSARAQNVTLRSGEYWIDQQFDLRKSVPITNGWQTELDVSSLSEGIHTFSFRASDSKGRWCAPLIKYFLRTVPSREGNIPVLYEYWTDGDFSRRVQGEITDGLVNLELDCAALLPGMHVFNIRTGDGCGQWNAPLTKFFLVPAPAYSDNVLTTYKYWLDGDYENAVTGVIADNGTVSLELDLNGLCKGLHTLAYQTLDSRGLAGSPVMRYFVVPDLLPENNGIVAYEYWFNAGPRVRVDVEPANPLVINDLWIEVKDVVPNEIPADYRFDVSAETVYCEDDVFFGIAAYDRAGLSTAAALSDTFCMTVPVSPDFIDLKGGEVVEFDAPGAGRIRGFRMNAAAGDSLVWTLNGACTADFYDSNGERMKVNGKTDETGTCVYAMKVATSVTYVLLHHAPTVAQTMDISCVKVVANSISREESGCVFRATKNHLTVEAAQGGRLRVVNTAGVVIVEETISAGTSNFEVPAGMYLLRWDDEPTRKILVP